MKNEKINYLFTSQVNVFEKKDDFDSSEEEERKILI